MSRQEGSSLPLLDSSVLEKLRDELEVDEGVWKVFIQNFLALLPTRLEKLRLALTTGDAVGARDAVLSLKTSSQMVGADCLASLALELEQLIRAAARDGEPDMVLPRLAATHLVPIRRCAEQTTYPLEAHLQRQRSA